jgi:serine/threonine-protein kinase HipA
LAGILTEDDNGYNFKYQETYLKNQKAIQVSLILLLQEENYHSENLFPFFDGLIPEGWLLDIAYKNWKINPRDHISLLLTNCRDCIDTISMIE